MDDATPDVVVAIPTFRRAAELRRCLAAVVPQALELARSARLTATVLVIDNEPHPAVRSIVTDWPSATVRYVHEPSPGLAAVRNRALSEAGDAAALVFVDDDESPAPGWLAALVSCWTRYSAAAVAGPVEPEFARPPSRWVVESGQFARRRRPTGTPLASCASNNLLLDLAAIDRLELRFDDRFGQTGGEDTDFARRLAARGGLLVWCDDAVVIDHLPADRLTPRWVLRRCLRAGTSWAVSDLVRTAGWRRSGVRAANLARGAVRITAGLAQYITGVMTGSVHHRARGACVVASFLGLLAGSLGYRMREYRRDPNAVRTASTTPATEPRNAGGTDRRS